MNSEYDRSLPKYMRSKSMEINENERPKRTIGIYKNLLLLVMDPHGNGVGTKLIYYEINFDAIKTLNLGGVDPQEISF